MQEINRLTTAHRKSGVCRTEIIEQKRRDGRLLIQYLLGFSVEHVGRTPVIGGRFVMTDGGC